MKTTILSTVAATLLAVTAPKLASGEEKPSQPDTATQIAELCAMIQQVVKDTVLPPDTDGNDFPSRTAVVKILDQYITVTCPYPKQGQQPRFPLVDSFQLKTGDSPVPEFSRHQPRKTYVDFCKSGLSPNGESDGQLDYWNIGDPEFPEFGVSYFAQTVKDRDSKEGSENFKQMQQVYQALVAKALNTARNTPKNIILPSQMANHR